MGGLIFSIPYAIHEKSANVFLYFTLGAYIIGAAPAFFAWIFYFCIYLKIFHEEITYLKSLVGGAVSGVIGGSVSLVSVWNENSSINPTPAIISILVASILAGGFSAVFTEYVARKIVISGGNRA